MLISLAWLKEIVAVDRGAADIARALTARGLTVDAVTRSGDDTVFDIDVPANRPDSLGHRGVAREIAAAFSLTLAPVAGVPPVRGTLDPKRLRVAIEDPDLCGRYTAGLVAGVAVGPSPDPVVRRLEACGLRSINNVVDISNLVLLELGQPVHFFDLDTLEGPAIVVRRARAGETITTLDGVARALGPDYLVIADARRPVALAGVMGGADTEIRDRTRRVLIEAAWFSPAAVRRTSRDLGLVTDASQRFSRGCDPEAPWTAQALSAHLLARLASGTPESPVADLYPGAPAPARLTVSLRRAETLLGFRPSQEEAVAALAAVGLAPEPRDGTIAVTVPSWRVDLTREADLVEEIGRHLGYDRVPARRPPTASFEAVSPALPIEERSRDRLAALGFHEAVSYAMIAPGEDAPFVPGGTLAPLALANPISEAMSVLRRSLAPALARAAASNLRYGTADVRLFEVGRVFRPRGIGGAPEERLMAGFAWAGSAQPPHWSAPARAVDAYDAAGLVCDLLGPGPVLPDPERCALPALAPGRGFEWRLSDGTTVAWCGPLHPEAAERLDAPAEILLGEIDLDAIAKHPLPAKRYAAIARLPAVTRDLSIVLTGEAAAGEVVRRLAALEAPAPACFSWIDRFSGAPLRPGEIAMTLRVILQPRERTLTDDEAERYRERLIAALEQTGGARLRRIDR